MDMGKIRDQDRPYVHEVVQYLRGNNLEVELRGSAKERDDYADIDLLATGELSDIVKTMNGFVREGDYEHSPDVRHPFPEASADDQEYRIAHAGRLQRYMNENVNERYTIEVGETKIDVCLKATDACYKLHTDFSGKES